jgi:hypothetical protein
MEVVQRAANAPANPSAQDRAVAARAAVVERQAEQELKPSQSQGGQGPGEKGSLPAAPGDNSPFLYTNYATKTAFSSAAHHFNSLG